MSFPADFPGAIVVEAANYGYIGYKNHPKAWCLHTPEERPDDYPGTPYYFHNTDRQASTTYFVSYLGFVFQCVPESEGAYANAREGVPGYFDWEDRVLHQLNLETLSVEIEGYAASIHQTMPRGSPQWVALVRLMAHRCRALGIPPERTFGHKAVSIYRSDPGQLNIAALVADVNLLMQEVDMILVKGNPSGKCFVIGPAGKRWIDDPGELAIYQKRVPLDDWQDTEIDLVADQPDFGAMLKSAKWRLE